MMYYEVVLTPRFGKLTVPSPGDIGEGWAMDADLIEQVAQGYHCEELTEADLPAPLDNPTYPGLRLYRVEGRTETFYFGIIECD